MFERFVRFFSFGTPVASNWYELVGKIVVAGAASGTMMFATGALVAVLG